MMWNMENFLGCVRILDFTLKTMWAFQVLYKFLIQKDHFGSYTVNWRLKDLSENDLRALWVNVSKRKRKLDYGSVGGNVEAQRLGIRS